MCADHNADVPATKKSRGADTTYSQSMLTRWGVLWCGLAQRHAAHSVVLAWSLLVPVGIHPHIDRKLLNGSVIVRQTSSLRASALAVHRVPIVLDVFI